MSGFLTSTQVRRLFLQLGALGQHGEGVGQTSSDKSGFIQCQQHLIGSVQTKILSKNSFEEDVILEFGLWSLPPGNSCFVLFLIKMEEQRDSWWYELGRCHSSFMTHGWQLERWGCRKRLWFKLEWWRAPASSPLWRGDFLLRGVTGPFSPWGVIWRIWGRCFYSDREWQTFPKLMKPCRCHPTPNCFCDNPRFLNQQSSNRCLSEWADREVCGSDSRPPSRLTLSKAGPFLQGNLWPACPHPIPPSMAA